MNLRCLALAALLSLAPAAKAADAPPPDPFEQGANAYHSGDYDAALAAFLQVQPDAASAANLQLNLGLTYYKLRRYEEARAAFERLRDYPGYKDIADFHLGLIAARLGERERAMALWQPLATSAAEPALRERASVAMSRLQASTAPTVFLSAAAGYDSNPALIEESAQPSGSSASPSLDVLGTVESTVSRNEQRDVALHAGGYWRDYTKNNGLDQGGLFGGLERQSTMGSREASASLEAGTSVLGGSHFLDSVSGTLASTPRSGGAAFSAQLARLQAEANYRYLQGWRLRGAAEWIEPRAVRPWRVGYLLEVNDREDLASPATGEFFSHSPISHSIGLIVPTAGPAGWSLRWSARYRYSFYRKPDVFLEGAALREQRRIENLLQAGARLRRPLSTRASAFVQYEYSHNASTIDTFDYSRHLLQVGIEWFSGGG